MDSPCKVIDIKAAAGLIKRTRCLIGLWAVGISVATLIGQTRQSAVRRRSFCILPEFGVRQLGDCLKTDYGTGLQPLIYCFYSLPWGVAPG
jgi:hypothetical protein